MKHDGLKRLKGVFYTLTFRLYLSVVIGEYINDVELRNHHAEASAEILQMSYHN